MLKSKDNSYMIDLGSEMMIKKVLTIAGSDTSGGAGLEADLKTFTEYQTYGMCVITTIVTMDPKNHWSHRVDPIGLDVIKAQLETVLDGTRVTAVKTGMLGSTEVIAEVANAFKSYHFEHVVVDPVMICKGENDVLHPETVDAMVQQLLPYASITTPNLFEASVLAKMPTITTVEHMKEAAKRIYELGVKAVVVKGGNRIPGSDAVDVFYDGTHLVELSNPKVDTTYNHGAGCTFAAAITAGLAQGMDTLTAVKEAKVFVTKAIEYGFKYNDYVGPVFHSALRQSNK